MYKVTLSQMFQAGKGVWARPSLRLFVTYSETTDEWNRGGDVYGTAMSASGETVDEVTFGFNVETWW
jgi:maltoporin